MSRSEEGDKKGREQNRKEGIERKVRMKVERKDGREYYSEQ